MDQIDPITGLPVQQGIADPSLQVVPGQVNPTPQPLPANLQGGRQQSFITPQQQQTGQGLFNKQEQGLGTPLLQKKQKDVDNAYNHDWEQSSIQRDSLGGASVKNPDNGLKAQLSKKMVKKYDSISKSWGLKPGDDQLLEMDDFNKTVGRTPRDPYKEKAKK
jgi:hypothetical protein